MDSSERFALDGGRKRTVKFLVLSCEIGTVTLPSIGKPLRFERSNDTPKGRASFLQNQSLPLKRALSSAD